MKDSFKLTAYLALLFSTGLIVSARSHQNHKNPDNKPVRLIFNNELYTVAANKTPECQYIGEIIGSEGHWYTYLFVSNTNLTQGALNQIHNKANDLGANVVFISGDLGFTTSVTFFSARPITALS